MATKAELQDELDVANERIEELEGRIEDLEREFELETDRLEAKIENAREALND